MADSYEHEVVRHDTAASDPAARPVAPVTTTAVYRHRSGNYRAMQAVWWIVGFLDTLIAIRFLLKLFGANPAPFVQFIYDVTWPLVGPFHGIFNTDQVGRSVLEPESLVAIAIYTLIGWGVVSLMRILAGPTSSTSVAP